MSPKHCGSFLIVASTAFWLSWLAMPFFPADEAALLTAHKRRLLETGGSSSQELALTVGGERRIYREALEALPDHAGNPIGIIGSATDITEEKRLQEQLSEALGFRDRMMGVLGHDLRNPLNAGGDLAATGPDRGRAREGRRHRAGGRSDERDDRDVT